MLRRQLRRAWRRAWRTSPASRWCGNELRPISKRVDEQLQLALTSRVVLEQAKGVLSHTADVDIDMMDGRGVHDIEERC